MHRFYVPDIDATDRSISLDGSIARQLKTVLRADTGEHIRLFDGSGSEWEVEIDHVGKNDVSTTLVSAVRPVAEPTSTGRKYGYAFGQATRTLAANCHRSVRAER